MADEVTINIYNVPPPEAERATGGREALGSRELVTQASQSQGQLFLWSQPMRFHEVT